MQNKDLRNDYLAVGKNYAMQNQIRMKWAKGDYGPIRGTRQKITTFRQVKRMSGTWESPNMIWQLCGNGLEGLMQMKNHVLMAATVGSRFMSWNASGRTVEVLFTKKKSSVRSWRKPLR